MSQIERFINNVTPLDAKHLNELVDTLNTLVDKNETVQVDIGNLNDEIENINVLKSQYETIEKKVDDHIESCSGGETSIDDTTISTDRTWSSAKIEDFVHINDDVVWSTVQGENLSIDYTKEGYLREVEIWGNTWQDTYNSKNLFNKDNVVLLKETVNEATSYTVEGNTVKFEIPNSGNQFKFRIRLDRKLDISKSYKISYSSYRAFVNGEWITSGIVEGSQSIEEGNIFNVSFIKDWLPITKFEVTNLQIEEGGVATSYEPYHKADLSNIQHLGELYVDEEGQPILDSEGREQYKIEIESRNFYTNDLFYLGNNVSELNLEPNFINTNNVRNSKFTIELECGDFKDGKIIYFKNGYSLELSKEGTALKLRNFNTDVGDTSKMFNCNKGDIISIVYNGIVNLYVNGNFIVSLGWLQYYGNICVAQNLSFLKINTISVAQEHLLKSEPKAHKTTILLPCQLCKVGDISDRLFWDSSKGRYVVEKNIIDKVFNGSEEWRKWGANTDELKSFDVRWLDIPTHDYLFSGISDIFPPITGFNALYGNNGEGIAGHSGNWFVVCISSEKAQDLTFFKNWLSVNNLRVYHRCITPQLIETNITKEILVPCYKDKTHLFVTGGIDGTIKAKIPLDGGQAIQSLSVMNLALNEEVSTLSLENEELKSTNDTQDELINTTMLATDEMYMMIEPLLSESVQTLSLERSVSKMVDMYVAMVQRGLKTIDEVPARYREQVKEILAQLEK